MNHFYNYGYNPSNCSYYNILHEIFLALTIIIIASSASTASPSPASSTLSPTTTTSLIASSSKDTRINNNNIIYNANNNLIINQNRNNSRNNYLDGDNRSSIDNRSSSTSLIFPPLSSKTSTSTVGANYDDVDLKILFSKDKPRRCPGIQIRNSLQSFEQLRNCNIIDGSLTIALVQNLTHPYKPEDYDNLTFPHLYEITEYLLFFRVEGLSSLSKLFPNLAVIRGKQTLSSFAFIIYQMFHLKEINLPHLSDILHGSVRIENNPNLCFVTSVNWANICKHQFAPHFIKNNNKRCNNKCPDNCRTWKTQPILDTTPKFEGDISRLGSRQDNGTITFCWNNHICQEPCHTSDGIFSRSSHKEGCCSPQCAGGCYEPDQNDQCFSCRSVVRGNKCLDQCDDDLYEYAGRCIDAQECLRTKYITVKDLCNKNNLDHNSTSTLKAIRLPGEKHGRCQINCPPGYSEDELDKSKCKPCDKGKCRKVCTPSMNGKNAFVVNNVNSLRELNGCNYINGSLEITLKGGKNVLNELQTAFQDLEEIEGYLKISRSHPIITLSFLSKLKLIKGAELDRGHYAFVLMDNPNLQELFVFNQSDSNRKYLTIPNGKIFAHRNPKLCLHRIENLQNYCTIPHWDTKDIVEHSNGDKEACSTDKLKVKIISTSSNYARVAIQNYAQKMNDTRSLLYYLINYREVQTGNVTMFDGRDGCNSQNDLWTTVEESPNTDQKISFQETIIKVRPARRYAIYVKTFTIHAATEGALSDIIYFETAPDRPTTPQELQGVSNDAGEIILSWAPPSKPNGILRYYRVVVYKSPDQMFSDMDICPYALSTPKNLNRQVSDDKNRSPQQDSTTNKKQPDTNIKITTDSNSNSNEDPSSNLNTCSALTSESNVNLREEVLTFQDSIIDMVYLKQCPSFSGGRNLKKRWVEYDSPAMTRITNTINNKSSYLGSAMNLYTNNTIDSTSQTKSTFMDEKSHSSSPSNETKVSNLENYLPQLPFNPELNQTQMNLEVDHSKVSDKTLYKMKISNLRHYTSYVIAVYACHINYTSIEANFTLSSVYNSCSYAAMTLVRTQSISELDKIRDLRFNPANDTKDTNSLSWEKPENPNGEILGYQVEYRPKSLEITSPRSVRCINVSTYEMNNGIILEQLSPGSYMVRVGTLTSLFLETTDVRWSEEVEFQIEIDLWQSPRFRAIAIITFLIVSVSIAVAITYYFQKIRHEKQGGLVYASVNPDYVEYVPDEWEVDIENLQIGKKIGVGSFGTVFEAILKTEKGKISCAVKTVSPKSTPKQRVEFLHEASIMKQFDTFHVVKLIGLVSITTPIYVIMEHMALGDLKSFLTQQRPLYEKQNKKLVDGIYLMAAQIADGMAYLSSKKCVHRDLAARNCMVGENRVVKIGDFGLTRDTHKSDYYHKKSEGRLPVKWMAPESFRYERFTYASDVWSYGIVVWEMVTFCETPYQGLSNEEVTKYVQQGYTMQRPEHCPDKLYHIMQKCWQTNEKDRPTFVEILELLLPLTEDKLYPNCFYRKQKAESGDQLESNQSPPQPTPPISDDIDAGAESFPLLSWPSNHTNGMTNGINHVVQCLSK